MANKSILSILQEVQDGMITPEDAVLRLKAPFEDLEFAKVDYHRAVR